MLLQEVTVIHFELGLQQAEVDAGDSRIDVLSSNWHVGDPPSPVPRHPEPLAAHGRVAGSRDLLSRGLDNKEPGTSAEGGEEEETGEGLDGTTGNVRCRVLVPSPLPLTLEQPRLPRFSHREPVSEAPVRSEPAGPPASATHAQVQQNHEWLEAAERRKQVYIHALTLIRTHTHTHIRNLRHMDSESSVICVSARACV